MWYSWYETCLRSMPLKATAMMAPAAVMTEPVFATPRLMLSASSWPAARYSRMRSSRKMS